MKPSLIRITLDEDGQARYWPFIIDDYGDPLPPLEALHLITNGQVPIELACNDPKDGRPHHYEILLEKANGLTTTSITLTRI